jgi:galactose-1-phosphate uridylyltransferase
VPDAKDDPLADPLALTPDNAVGRVRGRRCITAANVAMSDAWHALVVFDEPDPLRFDADDVEDYLSTAFEWARRVHAHDPQALHPFVFWNATWRAGASLAHGHLQVLLARGAPYARVEALRRAAEGYRAEQDGSYFEGVAEVHRTLGLDVETGSAAAAFAHLTPIREREVVLFGRLLDAQFFQAVGRALVAFRDGLGAESFNVAVYGPPLRQMASGWEGFPAVARIVDRGRLSAQTSDVAGMELFGQGIVTADPFDVAAELRTAL